MNESGLCGKARTSIGSGVITLFSAAATAAKASKTHKAGRRHRGRSEVQAQISVAVKIVDKWLCRLH
jgi:hypothetical protein